MSKRNCNDFTRMANKLNRHLCYEEMAISRSACEALDDITKLFVKRVVHNINELMLASKQMQVGTTRKVLPAVSLLFPRIDPVTLKITTEKTILDEILVASSSGMARRAEGDDKTLFIRPARVRKLMERSLLRNKKTVRTSSGTRTAQTSITEAAPVFLAYVIQAFLSAILRDASKRTQKQKRSTVKVEHIHYACHGRRDLARYFSNSIIVGGRIMPSIHSQKT